MKGYCTVSVKKSNRGYFISSVIVALAVCAAQITGSTALIVGCLAAFTALACLACCQNHAMPVLLFFLPWSQLLRTNPTSFSFYTISMVLVCAICVVKDWRHFKRYHLVAGILLTFLTLLSKLIDGSFLSMNYIGFLMMFFMFPVVVYEWQKERYDFEDVVRYLSWGVIAASLCAQWFASYPNIARYIRVDAYLTIVRRCGFYGDPNFYTAQVTAALGGCLLLIMREGKRKGRGILLAQILLLVYCGLLSGSKSFILTAGAMLLVWLDEILMMRGRSRMKIFLLVCGVLAAIYISRSTLFGNLINVMITRFSFSKNLDSFTTGRMELWASYLDTLLTDVKVLLLGKGFTNVKLQGRASHNTVIQMIYQFGLIGIPVVIGWMVCFFKENVYAIRYADFLKRRTIIMLLGLFLPWMAIDVLFFDEFFLWQWYFILCLNMEIDAEEAKQIEAEKLMNSAR